MAWSAEQIRNASIIVKVGRQLGASPRDIQIGLMAAMVESGLRNLNYGDRDSIGMFQQRNAWGSRADRLDPYKSARMFFTGGQAGQRGLLDFASRGQMSMGAAAQAVQVSAYPSRYAARQAEAAKLFAQVKGKSTGIGSGVGLGLLGDQPGLGSALSQGTDAFTSTPFPSGLTGSSTQTAAEFLQGPEGPDLSTTPLTETVDALGAINTPGDALGGLTFDNTERQAQNSTIMQELEQQKLLEQQAARMTDPMQSSFMPTLDQYDVGQTSQATSDVSGWRKSVVQAAYKMLGVPYVWGGTSATGVDCSGLIALIYNQRGFNLPRVSASQARSGARVSFKDLKAGDLVAIDNSSRNNGADHIGIYVGNGKVIHAPRPGKNVEVTGLGTFSGGWGIRLR